MITTNRTARRATKTTIGGEKASGRGVPRRALADGVVERRRTSRRHGEPPALVSTTPERGEQLPPLLSASEHYRLEVRRRADRITGDLATLLAEAKAEYEAHINAPRPAGKGGRPKKKKAAPATEIELDEADAFGADEAPGE